MFAILTLFRNDDCKRNSNDCKFLREEEDEDMEFEAVRNNKNTNSGKPKYANCEKFFGSQVKDIFEAANKLLGGCSDCAGPVILSRNNGGSNCVRNNKCKNNEETRNNKVCIN
jgi:hypothetical protein